MSRSIVNKFPIQLNWQVSNFKYKFNKDFLRPGRNAKILETRPRAGGAANPEIIIFEKSLERNSYVPA